MKTIIWCKYRIFFPHVPPPCTEQRMTVGQDGTGSNPAEETPALEACTESFPLCSNSVIINLVNSCRRDAHAFTGRNGLPPRIQPGGECWACRGAFLPWTLLDLQWAPSSL